MTVTRVTLSSESETSSTESDHRHSITRALIASIGTHGNKRTVTYSQAALLELDYPCELDDKVVSDHDWVVVDNQREEVIDCSFSRSRLTVSGTRV